MADLDDFFAKKDKKKAKGKKFTTTEQIAKKLEETGKKVEKAKLKEKPINPEGEESRQTEDEEEWKDFEEEKKDYSGLKIGNLTVNESVNVESEDDRGTGENSSDGESGEGSNKVSGPWKKPEQPAQPEVVEEPAAPPPPVATTTTTKSTYVPPHIKRAQTVAASPRPRGRNMAPDINSEEYFPTLNSGKKDQTNESTGPWGRRKREEGTFEEVRNRGGSRSYGLPESQTQAPKLSLGNKYGALSQDQS